MSADPQQYITIEEVMAKLEATRAQVYRLVRDGLLKGDKIGRSLRFDASAVQAFAAAQAATGASLRSDLDLWLSRFAERLGNELAVPTGQSEDELVTILVRMIIADGVASETVSIHFDPVQNGDRLLYRSEDNLVELGLLHPALARRLKDKLTSMTQLAADSGSGLRVGHSFHEMGAKTYQIHLSIAPTPYGEHCQLRLHDPACLPSLEALGYSPLQFSSLRDMCKIGSGLLLVVEPADTVCEQHRLAMAKEGFFDKPLVLSLEHRFHFPFASLSQLKVPMVEGDSIEVFWDSILEMGPDVIMIDEVRDAGGAKALFEAVDSGVLVVAHVRAPGIVDAVQMLAALGLSGASISRVLIGAVKRSTFRKLCPHPREERPATRHEIALLGISEQRVLFESPGCEICTDGFFGRRHLFGLVAIDEGLAWSLRCEQLPGVGLSDLAQRSRLSIGRAAAKACLEGDVAFRQVESLLYREEQHGEREGTQS